MDLMTSLRRRGKLSGSSRKVRRPEIVDAAWSMARDRIVPPARKRGGGKRKRVMAIGAIAAVAAAVTGTLMKAKARVGGQPDEPQHPEPSHDGKTDGNVADRAVDSVGVDK